MLGVADHTAIENLDLGLDLVLHHTLAQDLQQVGGVFKDEGVAPVEGAHVVGTHLRLQGYQMLQPLLVGGGTAGGGQVEDDIHPGLLNGLPYGVDHLGEHRAAHGGPLLLVPHMDVGDGRSGLGAGHHVPGDLLGGDGDVGVSFLGGAPACEGHGYNEFVAVSHV